LPEKSKEQRLFGAACLKVKLQGRGGGTNEIYESALKDLGLTDDEVEAYLSQHRDMVEAALEAHGRPRS
jgi:hypothetical protein